SQALAAHAVFAARQRQSGQLLGNCLTLLLPMVVLAQQDAEVGWTPKVISGSLPFRDAFLSGWWTDWRLVLGITVGMGVWLWLVAITKRPSENPNDKVRLSSFTQRQIRPGINAMAARPLHRLTVGMHYATVSFLFNGLFGAINTYVGAAFKRFSVTHG